MRKMKINWTFEFKEAVVADKMLLETQNSMFLYITRRGKTRFQNRFSENFGDCKEIAFIIVSRIFNFENYNSQVRSYLQFILKNIIY